MFQAKVWGRIFRVFLHQLRLFCVKAVELLDCTGQRNLKGQNRISLHRRTLMKKRKNCLCRRCSSGRKDLFVFIDLLFCDQFYDCIICCRAHYWIAFIIRHFHHLVLSDYMVFCIRESCCAGRKVKEAEIRVQNDRGTDSNRTDKTTGAWSYKWTGQGQSDWHDGKRATSSVRY